MSRCSMFEYEPEDTRDVLRMYAWDANLDRQIKGKRGQAFLRELLAALEALPSKRLVANELAKDGEVCTLGALALKRRTDAGEDRERVLADLGSICVDPDQEPDDERAYEDMEAWAKRVLACPSMLAFVIPHENDEDWRSTPEQRYTAMVMWVRSLIMEKP